MSRFKRWLLVAVDFLDGIGARKLWTFAAASAFYLFLSLIPILGLVCALLPFTPMTDQYLLRVLSGLVPDSLYAVLRSIIVSIYESSTATLSITAVASVWTASLSMQSLMRGMDAAYDLKRRENFLIFRLRACAFMLVTLAAILLTLCGIVYREALLRALERNLSASWAAKALFTVLRAVQYPVMALFLFMVFLTFCRWMPAGKRKLMKQWPGALLSTVAWLAFSYGFSLYAAYSDRYGIYGALGTVIVALLWMYYLLFLLLLGAYLNRFLVAEKEKLENQ